MINLRGHYLVNVYLAHRNCAIILGFSNSGEMKKHVSKVYIVMMYWNKNNSAKMHVKAEKERPFANPYWPSLWWHETEMQSRPK